MFDLLLSLSLKLKLFLFLVLTHCMENRFIQIFRKLRKWSYRCIVHWGRICWCVKAFMLLSDHKLLFRVRLLISSKIILENLNCLVWLLDFVCMLGRTFYSVLFIGFSDVIVKVRLIFNQILLVIFVSPFIHDNSLK